MMYPLFDFVLASVLMGVGIGADVAAATFAQAKQLRTLKLAVIWIVGVSLTHTLFPMLGYLLTYFSIQFQPALTPLVGIIAFFCIFFYLRGEFTNLAAPDKQHESKPILVTLGLILAVSWDALWSGPAKSAQVIGWPELFVWLSFVVVGVLVSILAIASLRVGIRLQTQTPHNHRFQWLGFCVQYSVIAYFGMLALLRYTLSIEMAWWQIMMISIALVTIMLMVVSSRVKKQNQILC